MDCRDTTNQLSHFVPAKDIETATDPPPAPDCGGGVPTFGFRWQSVGVPVPFDWLGPKLPICQILLPLPLLQFLHQTSPILFPSLFPPILSPVVSPLSGESLQPRKPSCCVFQSLLLVFGVKCAWKKTATGDPGGFPQLRPDLPPAPTAIRPSAGWRRAWALLPGDGDGGDVVAPAVAAVCEVSEAVHWSWVCGCVTRVPLVDQE